MGLSLSIPRVIPNDWNRLDLIISKIKMKLGQDADVVHANITLTDLIASRLVATDGNKTFASIDDLTAWVAGTDNEIIVTSDGDGSITLSLPADYQSWEGGSADVTLDTLRLSVEQPLHTGDSPTFAGLTIDGAISSGTLTVTTGAYDALDVTAVNTVFLDCSGGAITIGGLVGGVNGQVLYIARLCASAANMTLEHIEGTGNQDIYLHAGLDETIFTEYGGWVLICNGTSWFDTSHSKHV